MKNLKTLLGAFAVAVLLGGTAMAAGPWNLSQGDRGETVFTDKDGVRAPAGANGIMLEFTNISEAWTRFVTVHRGGVVTKAYVVIDRSIPDSGTANAVTFATMWSSTTNGDVWTAVNGLSVSVTAPTAGIAGNPGAVASDTVGTSTFADKNNESYRVESGESIAVISDGADGEELPGSLIIIVE